MNKCGAALFLDVLSGFDRSIRAAIMRDDLSVLELASIFNKLNLDPDCFRLFLELLSKPILEVAGVPEHLRELIANTYRGSWITSPGAPQPVRTFAGTRPGEPLGDLTFNFLQAAIYHKLVNVLRSQGLLELIPYTESCVRSALPSAELETPFIPVGSPALAVVPSPFVPAEGVVATAEASDVSYVDDGVIPFSAKSPAKVIRKAKAIASSVVTVFSSHGLVINFGAGKSEFLLAFSGPGSAQARHDVFTVQSGVLKTSDSKEIFIVECYKHLGTKQQATTSLGPELAARAFSASDARSELKHILCPSSIEESTRLSLNASLVESRLFQNAGTWATLPPRLERKLRSEYAKSHRVLTGSQPWLVDEPLTDRQLLVKLKVPSAEHMLAARRLGFLCRFLRAAKSIPPLIALVQECDRLACGWPKAVRSDIRWLFSVVPRKLEHLGPPQGDLSQWIQFIHDFPIQFKALVTLALEVSVKNMALQEATSAPGPPSCNSPAVDDVQPYQHVCLDCGYAAKSLHGLQTHRAKRHGYVHVSRRLAGASPTCRVCLVNFWSRPRLLRHLREEKVSNGCTPCLNLLLQFAEPLPVEEQQALDEQEAVSCRAARRTGHQRPAVAAPPIPVYGPRRHFPGHTIVQPRFRPRSAALVSSSP